MQAPVLENIRKNLFEKRDLMALLRNKGGEVKVIDDWK